MAVDRDSFHWCDLFFAQGQEVDDKAPVVAACPGLFDVSAPVVEQATAAPGEKRTVTRKAKA